MAMFVERKSNVYRKTLYRSEISQAWYPAHVACCVPVGKPAQFRRSLLIKIQSIGYRVAVKRLHISNLSLLYSQRLLHRLIRQRHEQQGTSRTLAPLELPVTPRVRVLETIDLSTSGIEHFLGNDAVIPVTPKLTALTPVQETKASPPDSITA